MAGQKRVAMTDFPAIPPDAAICPDCLRELFDSGNRRYRYPFISCSYCGPRFTILKELPAERSRTVMSSFGLCPGCEREFWDASDRRFQAQALACPACGPQVWLEMAEFASSGVEPEHLAEGETAIKSARAVLAQGKIVAIKAMGGFHLICDAANPRAINELRKRKLRVEKPFELMFPDIEMVEKHFFLDETEKALLSSSARPVVLLRRRPESNIAPETAPGQQVLGIRLPSTPLGYLLMEKADAFPQALVVTSGNLAEEPVAISNEETRERLLSLADVYLMHDRDIHVRCDDTLVRVFDGQVYPLRRSRGEAPFVVKLPRAYPPVLACGGELKNTFCMAQGIQAYLSHHIGDMDNYETLRFHEQAVAHYETILGFKPDGIAHDMNENYLATRGAIERAQRENVPAIPVQHHHAHVAACMAEHCLDGSRPVIGVVFDGSGVGEDGVVWGGEFLIADYAGYQRALHLAYFPLVGGEASAKKPARTAMALLHALELDWDERLVPVTQFCPGGRTTLRTQLDKNINTPPTSSVGRLFDAVSALAGVRQQVNYDAQAAIEFEALVDPAENGTYVFNVEQAGIQWKTAITALVMDVLNGVPVPSISARFHNGLAQMVLDACRQLRRTTNIAEVVLTGGVWQNMTLLGKTVPLLRGDGFTVYLHRKVPPNDGGLALGQAAVAGWKLKGW